jgi:hypothetical protein
MAYFKPDWKWTKKDGKKKERRPVVCCGTLYFVTTTVAFIGLILKPIFGTIYI